MRHRPLPLTALAGLLAAHAALAAPRITCDEPIHDFGVSRNAEAIDHTFVLRNAGDSELVINQVRTSCGCTTTTLAKQTLAPGENVPLAVHFSLVGRQGPQTKFIYVDCNDPGSLQYRLELKGEIRVDLEVKPPRVYLSQIPEMPPSERTVTVVSNLEKPLRILSAETNNLPGATVGVETVREGREYHVRLQVPEMPMDASGRHEGEVVLHTDHPDSPRISIPVSVIKQEELIVVPREIVMRQDPQPEPVVTRYLLVRPAGDRKLEVLGIEPPSQEVQVELTLLRQNQFRIGVKNLHSAAALSGKSLRIHVRRWDQKEQLLEVPIRVEGTPPAAAPAP